MQHKTVLGTLFFAACMTFALGPIANAQGEFKKRIKGTFEKQYLHQPGKRFSDSCSQTHFEKWVSDEASGRAAGELWCLWRYCRLRLFGAFVSSSQDLTVEEALLFSGVVHDKQVVQARMDVNGGC